MSIENKVTRFVFEKLRFFKRIGSTWHCQSWMIAFELGVPEETVREVLTSLGRWGFIRLSAWNYAAWREVDFREMSADNFFFNRDDCGYVRVRPVF
jgi:hypothetical protein